MKLKLSICIAIAIMFLPLRAQKENVNTKPYPYGNPVIRHMYTADAAPHVMPDGRVWMVTSVDHEDGGGYSTMHKYHTFSSADMVNWTDHGEVLNVADMFDSEGEPEGEDWALWAPDMIYYEGKYYLYFPMRILYKSHGYEEGKRKVKSYIAVAVSDAPDKKFTVLNEYIEGTRGIDPSVFIDDDGEKYLYYGARMAAKLDDNMKDLASEPVKLEANDEHFMEAIWMHKRNNTYYLSYHAHYDKPIDPEKPDDPERLKSLLNYGYGDNPFGPFTHGGVMNYELGVNVNEGPKLPGYDYVPWRLYQSNHGGIVEYHGQEYLFYHTSALSSWRQDEFKGPGTWTQRSVCIDSLNYNEDGTKKPVQQTLSGVGVVKVEQTFEIAFKSSGIKTKGDKKVNISFKSIELGTGYYYFGAKVNKCTGKAKVHIHLDSETGPMIGTLVLKENSTGINNGTVETFLRGANGTHNVYLVVDKEKDCEFEISDLRFFAGAPKEIK